MSATLAVEALGLCRSHAGGRSGARGLKVFENFNLTLPQGRILAILGPSGCGKSTLLRLVAGLDAPNAGAVRVYGEAPLPQTRRGRISLMSTNAPLLPWRNAVGNARLPLDLLGHSRRAASRDAEVCLKGVRLEDECWPKAPHEMSEGQLQRLRLAQALVSGPRLLLLDEPFSSVDEGLRIRLLERVNEHVRESADRSAIFITHHAHEAAAIADKVIILKGPPAEEALSIDIPEDPSSRTKVMIEGHAEAFRERLLTLADRSP
jgi:NitT/TauT family transport system ATP-binding protein